MGRWILLRHVHDHDVESIPVDRNAIPQHVAIIMDGNGRWAKQRGLPRTSGHRAGVETLRSIIDECIDLGIRVLTVFAFSTENWHRPKEEVSFLLNLLGRAFDRESATLDKKNVRIQLIGQRDMFRPSMLRRIEEAERRTASNTVLNLNIAWSYGGRFDITAAARKLAEKAARGEIDPASIDERVFADHLNTSSLPDPDLLIRTGGECRLSNFLLWQLAYAEIWVTPVFWPDFQPAHFRTAICDYQRRERRFGRL